ncbi:MAG: hypothetical protein ACLFQY_11040 [Desulfococcaceae bacterium]
MNSDHSNRTSPRHSLGLMASPGLAELEEYFRILPPGDARGKSVDPDKERAPMVMSFSRHRQIPLHWEKLVQAIPPDQTPDAFFLRRSLEASWGFTPHREPTLSDYVLTADRETAFSVPAYDHIEAFKEGAQLTSGEVIVRNCTTGSFHYLVPKPDTRIDLLSGKEAYETSWRERVDMVVTVFPMFSESPCKRADNLPDTPVMTGRSGRLLETLRQEKGAFQPGFSLSDPLAEPPIPRVHRLQGPADAAEAVSVAATEKEVRFIRRSVESSWGVVPHEKPPLTNLIIPVEAPKEGESARFVRASSFNSAEDRWNTEPLKPGETVLVHGGIGGRNGGTGGRLYVAVPREGETLDFLTDRNSYEHAWASQIDHLEPVMEVAGSEAVDAFQPFARAEEIDLSLHAIIEEFQELDAYSEFAKTLSEKADAIPKAIDADILSGKDIDGLLEKYRNLKLRYQDIEQAKKRLQNRARKLGYFLAIEDVANYTPVPEAEKYKVSAKKGELYRGVRKTAVWNESISVKVPVWEWNWFGVRTFTRQEKRAIKRHRRYTDYERVSMDLEPWESKRKALQDEGYDCFLFDLTDAGFTDENGQGIETVMARCRYDEAFRRRCALFIPAYEQRLTRGRIKTRYLVIRAPRPGIAPVAAPRLMIEEGLSYRTEWRGTELGELVYSLNLAPGESRTVSVTRTVERQTETSRSITSVLDVTESRSNDLASAMETEAKNEQDRSRSSHWDAKASGSYGPFSASAGAGGADNQTSKQFARRMQSIAKNAAQSISRNTKEEVSATSRTTAKMESTESSVGQVVNINQGRTLNLLFYRLNNLFHGGVYLEDLHLVVIPGTEIIAGTGIQIPVTFRISELAEALDQLVAREPFVDYFRIDPTAVRLHALKAVYETILYEYLDEASLAALGIDEKDRKILPGVFDQSSGMLSFQGPQPAFEVEDEKGDAAPNESGRESIYEADLQKAGRVLLGLTTRNVPIEPHSIVVPSGALYLDALVGMRAATEPYSEEMRERELRLKSAEIEETQARAALDRARAETLGRGYASEEFPMILRSPVIQKAVSDTDRKGLSLFLSGPLPRGRWRIYHASEPVGELTSFTAGESRVTAVWSQPQNWLDRLDLHALRLVEVTTGIRVEG